MALDASQNLEDAELLARFAQGDRAAAQVLTARLAPVVYAQAFRMLGDRAEAEDITQDSLLRLWHAAPDWQARAGQSDHLALSRDLQPVH